MIVKMKKNLSKEGPYFFKIMFGTLNHEKLRIPPLFVNHISRDLSETAILKDSSNARWNVRVKNTGEHIYLEDGWEDFRVHHSLGNNEFLLFRYDGNMCFTVQIFNPNGCERMEGAVKQPESIPTDAKRKRGRPPKNRVIPKPIADSSSQEFPLERSVKLKHVKDGKTSIGIEEMDLPLPLHEFGSVKIKSEEGEREDIEINKYVDRFSGEGSSRKKAFEVWSGSKPFTSKNPYTTIIFSNGCLKSNVLHFSSAFSKAYLPQTKTKMILRNPKGEAWEVNCCPSPQNCFLCGGVTGFIHDNNIKAGNRFIFELVGEREMQLHPLCYLEIPGQFTTDGKLSLLSHTSHSRNQYSKELSMEQDVSL